jgi:hypothetical protein
LNYTKTAYALRLIANATGGVGANVSGPSTGAGAQGTANSQAINNGGLAFAQTNAEGGAGGASVTQYDAGVGGPAVSAAQAIFSGNGDAASASGTALGGVPEAPRMPIRMNRTALAVAPAAIPLLAPWGIVLYRLLTKRPAATEAFRKVISTSAVVAAEVQPPQQWPSTWVFAGNR